MAVVDDWKMVHSKANAPNYYDPHNQWINTIHQDKEKKYCDIETNQPRWKELYKIGIITAILSEIILVFGIVAYFIYPLCARKQVH